MIAARRAEKRRQERNIQKLIYGIVAEFVIVVAISSVMFGRLVATHNHAQDLEDQIKQLQTRVDEIQQLQTATVALQPKVNVLAKAKTSTLYWYTAVQNVSSSLPDSTWLTNLGTSGQPMQADGTAGTPGSASLNISGMASSQFVVGATMLRMNTYPTVDQVQLNSVSQATFAEKPVVNFSMNVQLKPTTAPKVGGSNVQKS
jgi:Tfp pilus assembly protein PilN